MRPPESRCACSRTGMSSSHGWHHDAKNESTTGRPRYDESVTGVPSSAGSVKSGATFPTRARRGAGIEIVDVGVVDAVLEESSRARINARIAAGIASDTTTSATTAPREIGRPPGESADEGVDCNGDEHQHEVHVRPA